MSDSTNSNIMRDIVSRDVDQVDINIFTDGSQQFQAAARNDLTHHVDTFNFSSIERATTTKNIAFDQSGCVLLEVTGTTVASFDLTDQYDLTALSQRGSDLTVDANVAWALFSLDGSKLFVGFIDTVDGNVVLKQYSLTTAFQVETGLTAFNVTDASAKKGQSAYFKPDGSQLLIVDGSNTIEVINLVDNYNFVPGSTIATPFTGIPSVTDIQGIDHKSNGYIGVLADAGDNLLHEYRLQVPYSWADTEEIATFILDPLVDPTSFAYSLDGRKAFVTTVDSGATGASAYDIGVKAFGDLKVGARLLLSRIEFITDADTETLGLASLYSLTQLPAVIPMSGDIFFTISDSDVAKCSPENPWFFSVKDESGEIKKERNKVFTLVIKRETGSIDNSNAVNLIKNFTIAHFYCDGTNVFTR